jgi:hypothetical protein
LDDDGEIGGTVTSRLLIGDVGDVEVVVAKSPYLSLMSLLVSVSKPAGPRRPAPDTFSTRSCLALRSFLSRTPNIPDLVASPVLPVRDSSVDEQVRSVRELSVEALPADVARTFDGEVPEHWRPAVDDPARWVDSFASMVAESWSILQPKWERASTLVDREIARAGVASVRGGLDCLLNSLHPHLHFHDGVLKLGNGCTAATRLGHRKLALVPLVHGAGAIVSFDTPEVAYVAYPMPGLSTLDAGRPCAEGTVGHPLASLIGPVRADILRTLRVPASMGQVANSLGCLPRTVTYHCSALESAGLVLRERRGQIVVASLTPRGEDVLDLFFA